MQFMANQECVALTLVTIALNVMKMMKIIYQLELFSIGTSGNKKVGQYTTEVPSLCIMHQFTNIAIGYCKIYAQNYLMKLIFYSSLSPESQVPATV